MTTGIISIKYVELSNGETIAYREREGGQYPVILLHGNMTSSKHWDLILENMDEKYKLFALDLRGFGNSSYQSRIESIKDFSEDVHLWTKELGLKDFTMIGWSMGGAVAMQYVSDYPGLCEKLILLASASTRGYPLFEINEDGTPNIQKRLETIEEVTRDTRRAIPVQHAYDTNNRELLKAIWRMTIYTEKEPAGEHFEEYVDDMRTQRNYAEVIHALNIFNISNRHNGLTKGSNQAQNIDIPVLVLSGERDIVVTENMTLEILEDIGQNAYHDVLKNCGHSPLVDDLGQLLEKIERFLEW